MDNKDRTDEIKAFFGIVREMVVPYFLEQGYKERINTKRGIFFIEKERNNKKIVVTYTVFISDEFHAFFVAIDGSKHFDILNEEYKFPEQWVYKDEEELRKSLAKSMKIIKTGNYFEE